MSGVLQTKRRTSTAALALVLTGFVLSGPPVTAQHDTTVQARSSKQRKTCSDADFRRERRSEKRSDCDRPGGSSGVAKGDFNGDGFADLAVGVPLENINGAVDAGAVNVIYGSSSGLTTGGGSTGVPADQFWHQDSPGVPGGAESYDRFGSALAAGEFNKDEYSDLAIGIPGENVGGTKNLGAVIVLYGSPAGLAAAGSQFWDPGDLEDLSENFVHAGVEFGASLAWGDFNNDDVGDLAVGAPGAPQTIRSVTCPFTCTREDAGQVHVIYGVPVTGLTRLGDQVFRGRTNAGDPEEEVNDDAEENDRFGESLAAGDFGSGVGDDLAIGVPREDLFLLPEDQGQVHVLWGSNGGLSVHLAFTINQNTDGVPGAAEPFDMFGWALAAGDFDGPGECGGGTGVCVLQELAIGIPFEDVSGEADAGAVVVGNVWVEYYELWHQDTTGIQGVAEAGDHFGQALATGDFNGDSRRDLAVGVPNERVTTSGGTSIARAGAVHILHGFNFSLLTDVGDQLWHEALPGFGGARTGNGFGASLTAWNFGRGDQSDLAIGVPGAYLFGRVRAGMVRVLYGSIAGLTTAGNQFWHQAHLQSDDAVEDEDQFGAALY